MHIVYETANGNPISYGTRIADPLPAGLTAYQLTDPERDGIRDGSLMWDAATRTVIDNPAYAAEAAAEAERDAARAAVANLDTYLAIDQPTTTQAIQAVDYLARACRRLIIDQYGNS